MKKHLEEFDRHIVIDGFRDVKIADVEGFLGKIKRSVGKNAEVQFFNAELVATWRHLYFAALNALNAFKNGENISKSLSIEALIYASAQRQIRKAMELMGIKKSSKEIALLIISENENEAKSTLHAISKMVNGKRDDEVLELSKGKIEKIRKAFEISDVELEATASGKDLKKALTNLVIERMALLATQR